ncbi:MAG: hypothetical protein EA381_00215 [Planctomycetaceae bacterium]|nr:MAG: hypothetical protein EA381_00215 [Planctomycetaceae bacterium]
MVFDRSHQGGQRNRSGSNRPPAVREPGKGLGNRLFFGVIRKKRRKHFAAAHARYQNGVFNRSPAFPSPNLRPQE